MKLRHSLILFFFPLWVVLHSMLCFYHGLIATQARLISYMRESLADFILAFSVLIVLASLIFFLEHSWGVWVLLALSTAVILMETRLNLPLTQEYQHHIERIQHLHQELIQLTDHQYHEKQDILSLRAQQFRHQPIEEQAQIALQIAKINLFIQKDNKNIFYLNKNIKNEEDSLKFREEHCSLVKNKNKMAVLNFSLSILYFIVQFPLSFFILINVLYFLSLIFNINVVYSEIMKCFFLVKRQKNQGRR